MLAFELLHLPRKAAGVAALLHLPHKAAGVATLLHVPRRAAGVATLLHVPHKGAGAKGRQSKNYAAPGRIPGALRHLLLACFVFCFAGILTAPAQAAPRDELLRLVPADVGFCLVIDNLRGHGKALVESPFVKQFRESAAASKWLDAPEAQKLGLVDQFLQQYLQVSSQQLRDDIFGDAIVLAYRPGPPDRPGEEQGLFLVRARDPKLLADLIARLNALQKESGDLKELKEHAHSGRPYFTRVESKTINHYYLNGPILAFASREETLREVIDADQKPFAGEQSAVASHFRLLGVDKPLAALWVNPRAFDRHLEQKAREGTESQTKAPKNLLRYWGALDGFAVTLDLQESIDITFAVRAKVEPLPAAAQRFLSSAAAPPDLWRRFPDHSLFAFACRTDAMALVDLLGEFLTDEARQAVRTAVEGSAGAIFGKHIVRETLPLIGPDWGICVVAPSAGGKHWLPEVTVALRVQPGKADQPAGLTITNALNTLAAMAVFHHNGGKPGALHLKSVLQDQVEVRYLVNEKEFPPGFEPAFAYKGDYLLLATSPEAIRRFPMSSREDARARPAGEFRLLRLSLKEISRYLSDKRSAVVALAAKQNQISLEEAEKRLNDLLGVLQFFDRVAVTQRSDSDRVIFQVHVRTAKPLK